MQILSPFKLCVSLKRLVQAFGVLAGLLIAQSSYAIEIKYEAIGPSVPGGDLWEYRYHVFGFTGQTDWFFDIFFPAGQYVNGNIQQNPAAPNADWDVLTVQPDFVFGYPHNGFYDAAARVDAPSTLETFNVSFIWSGPGNPGSQYFEVFDPNLTVQASGNTVPLSPGPSVPEPATVWLFVAAVPWLVRFNRKK